MTLVPQAFGAATVRRLKPGYRRLTTLIGLVGVTVGLVLLGFAFAYLCSLAGVPLDRPAPFDAQALRLLLALLAGIPICIYVGCALVAGGYAGTMAMLGRWTAREALLYALLSRYPARWFASAHPERLQSSRHQPP